MGKGTIASGGTDGLYQVTLDYGQAARDARVAKITADLAALAGKIAGAQALLDAQQAIEDAQKVVVDAAIETYITVSRAIGPALEAVNAAQDALAALQADEFATPEDIAAAQATLTAANEAYASAKAAIEPALKNYTEAASELATLKGRTAALRLPLELLKAQQAQQTKDLATWTALVLTETIPAWCADLTEDASGLVATVEIPGENALVLIAPAAPVPGLTDGLLTAREVQSPEQVFWNAAVLPGWQKWKPTYRLGTITALDIVADTASVDLDVAASSAQGLNVNQVSSLSAVPVQYMTCNALAFEVGDRCVVAFTGQDQATPKVIGFRDHPKACAPEFVLVPIAEVVPTAWVEEGNYQAFTTVYGYTYPECGLVRAPFFSTIETAYENYLQRRIVAGGAVYIPGDAMGWTAPAEPDVTLWEGKHGTIQDAPLASVVPVAHKTYNTSWVVGVSFGGLYIRSRTWPWGAHALPHGITPHYDVPACMLTGTETAVAHKGLTSISFDGATDDLGYPTVTPVVSVVDTSDFATMAAFLGTAAKVPATLTLTKGVRTLEYGYDGVTGSGAWGSSLYVKYKRPGAG